MYSRYPNYRFAGGVRVPNNYSGNTFKETVEEEPAGADLSEADAVDLDLRDSEVGDREGNEAAMPASKPEKSRMRLPGFNFNIGKLFSGGFGFEELLIIGMILLISQSGTDDDIILLLALLLFVG